MFVRKFASPFQIDSMFFDRRDSPNPNGKILVITCEGNAGFYEIGFLGSPLDAGFSVIGWNHPGFGGSSGAPFPDQEINAMDAVVQVFKFTRLRPGGCNNCPTIKRSCKFLDVWVGLIFFNFF